MREKTIETRLHAKVVSRGGTTKKWVSPGNNGVPDRIVLFKGGMCFFVETKAPGGRLSAIQKTQHRQLKKFGFEVAVLWNNEMVDEWVDVQASISELCI